MGRSFISFITLVMLSLFASCGKQPQVLKNVKVTTDHISNDIWLNFNADLNLGGMTLPAVTLPVIHPRTLAQVGKVEISTANAIKLGVNISELSDINSQQSVLPNGNAIPMIANNPTIEVTLGAGAKLYITVADGVTAIGFALPIKQFDAIGAVVGGINLFPVLTFDKIKATAGLFTSKIAGQNGIALVVDASAVVKMQDIYVPQGVGLATQALMSSAAAPVVKLDYSSQNVTAAQKDKIDAAILKLHNAKTKLSLNK